MVRVFILFFVVFIAMRTGFVHAATEDGVSPVNLTADEVIFEQDVDKITARGKVEVVQGEQTLHADQIIYNIIDDLAYAEGNVMLTDTSGDVYYADRIELSDQMRKGLVIKLYSELEDGSRLWAKTAERKSLNEHVLKDARYTPCKACEENPDKTPSWALRASKVTHDKESATLAYENARFEAWGVPIFYTPYFSHPDGTIQQKSGFLTPEVGFGSDLGFNAMLPYYWAISPSLDATTGVRFYSGEMPQLNVEMRKRFENALVKVQTSMTHSERTEIVAGNSFKEDADFRGHIAIDSLWNMNRQWRSGTELALATDEQYLDQYDIDDSDVLKNRLYVERFDERDYTSIELLAFQDLRTNLSVDQPNALPYANMSFVGAPNSVGGGRFTWDSSFLSLFREGNEQDMNRLSSRLGWQRRDILPMGLTSRVDLAVRGDAYHTNDRNIAKTDPTESDSKYDSRAFPTANVEIAYPLKKNLSNAQIRIKPVVGLTARPDVDNNSDIPNEDSQDAQIDAFNLFEIDRFPGLDRVEDRTRVNYGAHVGYYTNDGDEFSAFLGQSYRLENADNPFQNGSGIENQSSDVVGQVNVSLDNNRHNLNYRFQMDGRTLNSERHELYAGSELYDTTLSAVYLFEKGSPVTEFTESREQIRATAKHQLDENWSVMTSALYDLGQESGLRESQFGVGYDDDCFGVTVTAERDLLTDVTGASETKVFARFRLKNLGEFQTTAYSGTSYNGESAQ